MKGVVFNIFESFVEKNIGEEAWDEVLTESKLDEDVFVGPNTYDDSLFMKLVTTTISKFSLVPSDAIRAFGKFSFPLLVGKIPDLVAQFKSSREFLKGLDSIIHIEVKKLLKGAETPRFIYKEEGDSIILEYISKRNLPDFALGLIDGLSEHFNEEIKIETISSDGDKHVFKLDIDERSRE